MSSRVEDDDSGDEWRDTLREDEEDDDDEDSSSDDDDDDEEEGQSRRRRQTEWRLHAQLMKSGNRSMENISTWKSDMLEELAEDGSGFTKKQSYLRRGDASSIEEWTCAFAYRLKCPFKVRFTESPHDIVIEVFAFPCAFHCFPAHHVCSTLIMYGTHACCAQVTGEHNHDHSRDRSKGVPVKY